jgi:hypothetical protein
MVAAYATVGARERDTREREQACCFRAPIFLQMAAASHMTAAGQGISILSLMLGHPPHTGIVAKGA